MWRSDSESRILKTYVPAGKLCWPTPGTSNGLLKVTTVFRFQSSALAVDTTSKQSTVRQSAIPNSLSSFMTSPVFSPTNSPGGCSATRALYAVGFTRDLQPENPACLSLEPWKVVRG